MAPGPKKKGSYKRGSGDGQQDHKSINKGYGTEKIQTNSDEMCTDSNFEDERYKKRSVKSNWDKYAEPLSDPHSDKMRGSDFEVILSYSGGSGSQLQLQDEKDWDDAYVEKDIALDLKNLVQAMKSIPFHERIHLPSDNFNEMQVSKFISNAEHWKKSYEANFGSYSENQLKDMESLLDVVENPQSVSASEESLIQPCSIEDKTENIIASLTSSLSLKSRTTEKEKIAKTGNFDDSSKENDDLDFLLSLNISLNKPKPIVNEPESDDLKTVSVDDWLNSLLD